MTTLEKLQETEQRLAAELDAVREKIARGGAPDGWCFSKDAANVLWIKANRTTAMRDVDVSGIAWDGGCRKAVFLETACGNYCAVKAAALFAWVDRVRELGETDL